VVVMYVIIVYDISVERVNKVRAFLRQYLDWIQNSVFEGTLTNSALKEIELGLKEIIVPEEDSVIIYILNDSKYLKKKFIGEPKVEPSNIL
jgi:CRISPR-associated protein Cas2